MKPIFAAAAVLAFVALVGCATHDGYYGGSEPSFSTPSWGTSSSGMNEATDMPQSTAPAEPIAPESPQPEQTY